MDKITESLQKTLRKKKWKFNTLYNSLGRDGIFNMTSTCIHLMTSVDKERTQMSVVIDIAPSSLQFYITAYPFTSYSKELFNKEERVVSKWNSLGMATSLALEDDKGIPMPDTYSLKVYVSGIASTDGLDIDTWIRYIKLVQESTTDALGAINETIFEED